MRIDNPPLVHAPTAHLAGGLLCLVRGAWLSMCSPRAACPRCHRCFRVIQAPLISLRNSFKALPTPQMERPKSVKVDGASTTSTFTNVAFVLRIILEAKFGARRFTYADFACHQRRWKGMDAFGADITPLTIRDYDFSLARATLIASVPGRHDITRFLLALPINVPGCAVNFSCV